MSTSAYLPRPRLGQVRDDKDLLRRGEGADDLADLEDELLDERGLVVGVVLELGLERHEGVDGLAGELVRGADDRGFGDTLVEDESGFDQPELCRGS